MDIKSDENGRIMIPTPVGEMNIKPLYESIFTKKNTPMKLLVGAIRNYSGVWYPITETFHVPINIKNVTQLTDRVRVFYDFKAKKVNGLIAVVDETLANYGITCGSSVSDEYTDIKFYMPMSAFITGLSSISQAPAFIKSNLSLTTLGDGSGFKLTHPLCFNEDIPVISVLAESSQNSSMEARLQFDTTSVTVRSYSSFSGYIVWNGSAWVVTTPNIKKPTVAWNETTGVLTVTHEHINNKFDTAVHGRGGNIPVIGVNSETEFEVKFHNFDGTVITGTPNTNMRFFYSSGQNVLTTYPSDMRVAIRRGSVILNPAYIEAPSSNVWLMGMHETNIE